MGEFSDRCNETEDYSASQMSSCIAPEVSGVSGAGVPVVVASSVKVDDSNIRTKSQASQLQLHVAIYSSYLLTIIIVYLGT